MQKTKNKDTLKQVETYDKINNIIIILGKKRKQKGRRKIG